MVERHARIDTRVVDAQRHAGWGLAASTGFGILAVASAVLPHRTGAWLPLHLFLVGSLLCAISGTTQMLAVTWSTAPAPTDATAAAQLVLVAAGTLLVAAGRELGAWIWVLGGALLLASALVALGGILLWVRRWSTKARFHPAVDGYLVALAWGLVGLGLGAFAARGGSTRTPGLVEAHLAVNLLGLVGLVILCTLPFFAATQLRMRMSASATPVRIRLVPLAVSLGVVSVGVGALSGLRPFAAGGFLLIAATVGVVAWMLPRPSAKQFRWAGARSVGLLCGIAWWAVCMLALALDSLAAPVRAGGVLQALVVGAYGQILVVSVGYLAPVVRGGGHVQLGAGLELMKSWPGVVAVNAAALALLAGVRPVGFALVVAWALDTATRLVLLATGSDHTHGDHGPGDA